MPNILNWVGQPLPTKRRTQDFVSLDQLTPCVNQRACVKGVIECDDDLLNIDPTIGTGKPMRQHSKLNRG